MKSASIAKSVSVVGLLLVILPSVIAFAAPFDLAIVKWLALGGTATWFLTAPQWIGRQPSS